MKRLTHQELEELERLRELGCSRSMIAVLLRIDRAAEARARSLGLSEQRQEAEHEQRR